MPTQALWLLVLRLFVTLANLTSDRLHTHLKSFEVVSSPLRHCASNEVFPKYVNYSFMAFNKTFSLELTKANSLFAPGYVRKVIDDNGMESWELPRDCYYHGEVAGDPTSHVAVSTCAGGLMGSVLGHGHDFFLEPLLEDNPVGRGLLGIPPHAVYRLEDHAEGFSCGNAATSPLPLHPHDGTFHSFGGQHHSDHENTNSSAHGRHLMQTPEFTPSRGNNVLPSWVEIMVINDQVRSKSANTPGAVNTEDLVFQMDALYRRNTAFEPPIRLRLVAQESWLAGNKFDFTITAKGEIDQSNLLRDLLRYRYDHLAELPPHDVLVLLTGTKFIGSVSGLAYEQVMCTPTKSGAVAEMTKTLGMSAAIVSHEVGHTLGMSHDGTGNLCPVSGFIMAGVLTLGSPPDKWSTCSIEAMSRFFTMFQPKCMSTDAPKQGTGPSDSCGDGFLGGNEQCDCGSTDCTSKDPCCNGATCRFASGAECSANSPCCSKCKIVSATAMVKCFDPGTNTCQFAHYCDGFSAQCGPAQFVNVGTVCSVPAIPPQVGMLEGKCYRGECWSHALQCQQERFDTGCTSPNAALMLGNQANADVECGMVWCIVAKQKICTLIAGEVIKYKFDGVPCGTGAKQCYQGKCTTSYLLPGATPPSSVPKDQTLNACLGEACSGHGLCIGTTGTCSCSPGWTGRYCNLPSNPLAPIPPSPTKERRPVPFFTLTMPPTPPTRPPPTPPPTTRRPTFPPTFPPSPLFRPTSTPPSLLVIPFSPTPRPSTLDLFAPSLPPSPPSLMFIPFSPTSPPTPALVTPSSPPSLLPSSLSSSPPSVLPFSPTPLPSVRPTAASSPIASSPFAPLAAPIRTDIIAIKGKPFLFNASIYFFSPSGEAMIFAQDGLPSGSGLRMDPAAGFIYGTPTDADAAASPVALTLSVRNSGGSTSINSFLRVDTTQVAPRSKGLSPILIFDSEELNVNFADSFEDGNNDALSFSLEGLPPASGLQFSPSGLLKGFPSPIDVIAQPFRVTVRAEDGKGGSAEDTVLITIMSAAGGSLPGGPSPPLLIPSQCLREGVLFQLMLEGYFPNSAEYRFSSSGLPPGSGLHFDVGNRILYGAPNRFDVLASDSTQGKLIVTIVAADKQGRTVQQTCLISVSSANSDPRKTACIPISTGDSQEVTISNSVMPQQQPLQQVQLQQAPELQQAILPPLSEAPPPFITKLMPSLPFFGVVGDRDDAAENTPPLAATIGKQTATVDFPFILDVSPYFIDREREPLTFTISGLDSSTGLVFDSSTLSGTPLSQGVGTTRVTVTARDPKGLYVNSAFDLVINDRYKSPTSSSYSPPPASSPQWPSPPATSPSWPIPYQSPSSPPALSPSWPVSTWSAPTPQTTSLYWPVPAPAAPPSPTPIPIPRSAKDCQTLQWNGRGQSSVCASAMDAQGQCNSPAPFPLAVNTCSKMGARLCTFQELISGVAVSTSASCRATSVWWTTRLCEGGVQVFNSEQLDAAITCRSASDSLGVVCCADGVSQSSNVASLPTNQPPASAASTPTPAGAPLNINPIIAPRTTTLGVFQYFPLAPSFGGSQVSFSMQGLPQGTGFQLDRSSGTLFGSASLADMLASPISMLIRASQLAGTSSQTNFVLTVLRNVTSNDPVASLIPSSSATVDRPFLLDISAFFNDPQKDKLSFAVAGLPDNTGFRFMSATGIFFGAATQADLRAPQPLSIRISATNSRQGLAEQVLLLSILLPDADTTSPNARSAIRSRSFAPASAIVGQPFFVDISQHFVPAAGDYLAFSVQGLPTTTGFVVDSQAGVLYGSAINFDLLTPQPITLRVLADNKKGDTAEQPMYLTIIAGSEQGCQSLNWSPFDSMPDVCASNVVKPDGTCASPTSFRVAENMCRVKNARLCTSDELMADTSNDPSCSIDNARIWTSTLCPDGMVYTQAGSALFITSYLPVCTSKSAQLAFKCCADKQTAGTGDKNVRVDVKATEAIDFLLELSTYFTLPKPSSSPVFSLNPPFPDDSGLTLSDKGRISGRPTHSDVAKTSGSPILVTVSDGEGWSINLQLNITIQPQDNSPPILTGPLDTKVANVGAQVYFPLRSYFSDPDQDQLSFSLSNIATDSGFGIDPVSGAVFGVPTTADLGVKSLSISVFDGKGGTCSATLTVTVTQNNPPLSVSSVPRTVANRGQLYTCRLANYFVDPDKDQLTYAISGLPPGTGLTLDPSTGVISGSPSLADVQSIQPLTVRVQVSDGKGGKAFENVVILARDNQAPTGQIIPVASGKERVGLFFALSPFFQDPDGDALTYSISGLPRGTGLLLDSSSGVLAGLPSGIDAGPVQPLNLSVSVDDRRGGTATQSLQLVILNSQGTNAPLGLVPPPGGWGAPQRPSPGLLRQSTRDVVLGVLPPVVTQAGRPMYEMLFFGFKELGNIKRGTFTQIQGLPTGSGLALSSEGILSGVPSSQDQTAPQPMQLTITAIDVTNTTEVRKTLALTIITTRAPSLAPSTQPTTRNSDTAAIIDAVVGKPLMTQVSPPKQFQLATAQFKSFASVQSRLVGLPSGTGLSLDPISGTLSGIPNGVDLKAAGSTGLGLNVTFLLQTPLGTQMGQVYIIVNIQALPPPRSSKSCTELGWRPSEMLGVCANSQASGCADSMPYSAAAALCMSLGARLCSAGELENDAAKGSGCDLDQQRVWSLDLCGGGALTVAGSTMAASIERTCSAVSERYRVRCCADQDWGLLTRNFAGDSEFVDDEAVAVAPPTIPKANTKPSGKSTIGKLKPAGKQG